MRIYPIHESNDCHNPAGSPAGGQFCSDTKVEREGVTKGRKVDYRLVVDGVKVGRVTKKRIVEDFIAGKTSKTVWLVRRGPYDNGTSFPTQQEVEDFLKAHPA